MEKNKIRKEITDLINNVKEHSDSIKENEEIPQLELEAILHKIEQLYEKSIIFNYLNSISKAEEIKKTDIVKDIAKEETAPQPEKIIKEETKVTPSETPPAIDLFGGELPKVTEKEVEKKEEKATSNIKKPAITDIKSAIGINDKFQFINELFKGNEQEYSIAIQQLNSSEAKESAIQYFNSLTQLYSWDLEKGTVKRLLDLVDRRYN